MLGLDHPLLRPHQLFWRQAEKSLCSRILSGDKKPDRPKKIPLLTPNLNLGKLLAL